MNIWRSIVSIFQSGSPSADTSLASFLAPAASSEPLAIAEEREVTIAFSETPDAPQPFGYKTFWFGIKTSDPAAVIDALAFGEAIPANWETGLAAAYTHTILQASGGWAFITPPIDGWVLAMSAQFPHPVTIDTHPEIGQKFDALFSRLMTRFDDVQFFGSHRVVDLATWALAVQGKATRAFAFAEGEVLANDGKQTAEEAQLGLTKLNGLSPLDATDKIFDAEAFPDEDTVVALAGLWSIDPSMLEKRDDPPSTGFAVRLPSEFRE